MVYKTKNLANIDNGVHEHVNVTLIHTYLSPCQCRTKCPQLTYQKNLLSQPNTINPAKTQWIHSFIKKKILFFISKVAQNTHNKDQSTGTIQLLKTPYPPSPPIVPDPFLILLPHNKDMVTTICLKEKPRGNNPFLLSFSERKKRTGKARVFPHPLCQSSPKRIESRNENANNPSFCPFSTNKTLQHLCSPKKYLSTRVRMMIDTPTVQREREKKIKTNIFFS